MCRAATSHQPAALCKQAHTYVVSITVISSIIARLFGQRNQHECVTWANATSFYPQINTDFRAK